MMEDNKIIPAAIVEIPSVSPISFEIIFKHMYDLKINLDNLTVQEIMNVVECARKLEVNVLEGLLLNHLMSILTYQNVTSVYRWTELFSVPTVQCKCISLINANSEIILIDNLYLDLPKTLLKNIFCSDYFCEDELLIFQSICLWIDYNKEVDVDDLLACVRFSQISDSGLLEIVKLTHTFRLKKLREAIFIRYDNQNKNYSFRKKLLLDVNVAVESFGAKVIRGITPPDMLNGECQVYDIDLLLATCPQIISPISVSEQTTVIELRHPSFINCIQLGFTNNNITSYYFFLDVSIDYQNWSRITTDISLTVFPEGTFTFTTRIVKYIRVMSYLSSIGDNFLALTTFACRCNSQLIDDEEILLNGLQI